MPWRVEGVRQGEMLLCNDATGYSLLDYPYQPKKSPRDQLSTARLTYRSQESVHESIHLFWMHEITTFENSHRQIGNHHQMFFQHIA